MSAYLGCVVATVWDVSDGIQHGMSITGCCTLRLAIQHLDLEGRSLMRDLVKIRSECSRVFIITAERECQG